MIINLSLKKGVQNVNLNFLNIYATIKKSAYENYI